MTAKRPPKAGGKPPRRPRTGVQKAPSSSKPSKANFTKASSPKQDMLSWGKVVRDAPWVGRQSMGINPGDPAAISRLRHSKRYTARTKKVIRPRIVKHPKPKPDKIG